MEQKYGCLPGLLGVKVNFSPVSSTFDLNDLSSATTVCGISSRFVHVTVVPAFTVIVAAEKLKLSIFTSVAGGAGFAAMLFVAVPKPTTATSSRAAANNEMRFKSYTFLSAVSGAEMLFQR